MILYFDNYITNEPATSGICVGLESVRSGCAAYARPSRIEVAMYTLASYKELGFSNVLIKYELQDKSREEEFEAFVKSIFPKAKIVRGRSDSRQKYLQSAKMIREMGEEWVFYAGNADHVFVGSETKTFDACVKKAKQMREKYRAVSFNYSHFSEQASMINPHSCMFDSSLKVLEEDADSVVVLRSRDPCSSGAVFPVDNLEEWFAPEVLEGKKLIRTDSIAPVVGWRIGPSILVLPKREVCRHFDGYSHEPEYGFDGKENIDDRAPPLFLPAGFFEGNIRIAYGHDEYREGWVNVNPLKEKYSFRNGKNGTDLKLTLEELPLFWKRRIKEIDSNPKADLGKMREAYLSDFEKVKNPWPAKSGFAPINRAYFYWARLQRIAEEPELFNLGIENNKTVPHLWLKRLLYRAAKAGHDAGLLKKKR